MKFNKVLKQLRYYKYFHQHRFFYLTYISNALRRRFGRPTLSAAEIFFEPRCNYNCWHCSSSEYLNRKDVGLGISEIEMILTKLKSVGTIAACYVGGEPTLNKELPDIIRLTNSFRILPSVITNASLLSQDKIDVLFEAGLANIGFSLQSVYSETHNRLTRSKNAYERIMKMIEYCINQEYVCSICVVPTNENLQNGDFAGIVKFATERNLRINVNLPAPIGRLLDGLDTMLTEDSMNEFFSKYASMDNVLPDFKQFNQANDIYCPMGEYIIYIMPDGEVCPCTFTQISFGNILTDDIEKILFQMNQSQLLKQIDRNQCPISMDKDFIMRVKEGVEKSEEYPPRWSKMNL